MVAKIHKLVLKNFKSFKNAEVPIADGFTVIAGSNGSGKSNILDAILFGIGATSLKTIRASRLTDLVNNNASENYAKVDLHIKHNGKNYKISRMIDKQGKCIYRLDGNRVTLSEISSLLRELDIRPDGHNIVMQGDVTRVIEMSPDERRQIIDELAGLQEFDEKKAEAMKNLDKVETKIRDTNIVLHERETYLEDLEKERQAAVLFDSLEKEKKQIKATTLFNEIEKIGSRIKENKEKIREASGKREQLLTRVSEIDARIKADKEKVRALNEEIITANEKIFSTTGAKLEERRSEIKVEQERINAKRGVVEKNSRRTDELNERTQEKIAERKELENEKAGIKAELPQTESELDTIKAQREKIESMHSRKQGALQKLDLEIKALSQKTERLKIEELSKQSEAEREVHRFNAGKEKAQDLMRQKQEIEKRVEELEKEQRMLEALHTKEKNPAEALENSREKLEKSLEKRKGAQAAISALDEKSITLNKEIAECPVCDSPLNVDKKKQLLQKAKEETRALSIELARHEEGEKSIKERIKWLEELVFREMELENSLKILPVEREKNSELEKNIHEVKSALSEKLAERMKAASKKAGSEANKLLAEKEALEEERNALIKQLQLDEMNSLNQKWSSLQTKKSLAEQRIGQIDATLSSRLEKEATEIGNEINALNEENKSLAAGIEEGTKRAKSLEKEVAELEKKFGKAGEENRGKIKKKEKMDSEIEGSGEKAAGLRYKIRTLEQQENQVNIDNSGLQVRLTDLSEEFEPFKEEPRLKEFNESESKKRFGEIEKKIGSMGAINMKAIESFNELAEEVKDVRAKVEKLDEEKNAVLELIEKIEVKRTNVFMDCFEEVNKHFRRTFLDLFAGDGLLSLSNPEAPLEAGLIIEAKHKGNALQNIDSMSGGEKTLTALAFLFAIQLYEPAPFYIFDEADAALDKENSLKMVKIIKEISKQSQFIAITHNDPLIKAADQIIGVALNKQKSSVIGLKLRESVFEEKAD